MEYYESKRLERIELIELWLWLLGKVAKYGSLLLIYNLILWMIK